MSVPVSVIMPLYDKGPWVARALASLRAQTWRRFEVVVVNDGSTDDGPDQVARFDDPRVRLVHQANAGPGAARNRGAAEALGEVLAFLDADDAWDPHFLERNLAGLAEAGPKVATFTCGHRVIPGTEQRARLWEKRGIQTGVFRAGAEDDPLALMHRLAFMSPCATLIRRSAFERHGGFFAREGCRFAEDAHLFLKVLLHEPVAIAVEPRVTFFEDASALSRNLRGPRPVEPFLRHPEELEVDCPAPLRVVLRRMLAIRAAKTACMLAYWGRHEEARALLQRFEADRDRSQRWDRIARWATSDFGRLASPVARSLCALLRRLKQRGRALVPGTREGVRTLPYLDPTALPDPVGVLAAPSRAQKNQAGARSRGGPLRPPGSERQSRSSGETEETSASK